MPSQLQIKLSEGQRQELKTARDHHGKAYVREAASAILKVAEGISVRQVAMRGLLKARDPETISRWIANYMQKGIGGLQVEKGRGRKASFFPHPAGRSSTDGANGH
jgi:hypothetical protein